MYKIKAKKVTNAFASCLDEFENIIDMCEKKDAAHRTWGITPLSTLYYKKLFFSTIMALVYNSEPENIDLNSASEQGNTLLHLTTKVMFASTDNATDVDRLLQFINYLLQHNANPNIQNNDGDTAFRWCMHRLDLCSNKYSEDTTLTRNVVNLFLQAHADPTVSSGNNACIFLLAERTYSETTEQILKHMDIKNCMNIKDKYGDTPAHIATRCFNVQFLHMLTDAGADFNIKNAHGKTGLELALESKKDYVNGMIYGTERIKATIELLQRVTNTNK